METTPHPAGHVPAARKHNGGQPVWCKQTTWAKTTNEHTSPTSAIFDIAVIAVLVSILGCAPQGDYPTPALGVVVDHNLAVVDVLPASAAERAGLQVGDVLVALNGITYTRAAAWSSEVSRIAFGQVYDLSIQRGDQVFVLSVISARLGPIATPGVTPTPLPTYEFDVWLVSRP